MKLGNYRNLVVKGPDTSVSQQELERSITNMQRKNSVFIHIDDRPAKLGDVVVLNYEGFVDSNAFLGGKATHHRMVLGEGKYIPGFEEQIVGKMAGETFEIRVSFPDNYGNRQLAGKEAVFATKLLFVGKEDIPAFDDEFALDFSSFSTAEELRESLLVNLKAKKEGAEQERIQEELLTQIIETSDIPVSEEIIDELQEEVFEEKLEEIETQGMTLQDFLKASQQTMEDILYQCRKKARRSFLETSVLHAIAMEEEMEVYEDELEEAVWEEAMFEEVDPMELLDSMEEEELTGIKLQILCDKAMELVRETAIYG